MSFRSLGVGHGIYMLAIRCKLGTSLAGC